MNKTSFESKAAYEFASKVPGREKLFSIYMHANGFAFSTDGHRLFATRELFEASRVGSSYRLDDLYEKQTFTAVETVYPNVDHLLPTAGFDIQFDLKIPEWFELLSSYPQKARMILDFRNRHAARFVNDGLMTDHCFGIDGKLLAPLAGRNFKALLKDSENPIVLVSPESEIPDEPQDLKSYLLNFDWFVMVMPIRMDISEEHIASSSRQNVFV